MNHRKRYTAACPISYRPSYNAQSIKKVLGHIFSGYESCDDTELRDVCLQTDLNMADWDDHYLENIMNRFNTGKAIGDSRPAEEYAEVIESGDEDFQSVREEKVEGKKSDVLHSINIQLKDSPLITLEDGVHKTRISLTPNYLEKNGLELLIDEGPTRNVRLKAGDAEIYPSDKALPPDINISVTDERDSGKEDVKDLSPPDVCKTRNIAEWESPGKKLGLMSVVIDNIEQQYDEQFNEETSVNPGGPIVQCISDYDCMKAIDKREVGIDEKNDDQRLGRIQRENTEIELTKQMDPETLKLKQIEMYKEVKKDFFKSVLAGDPRMDNIKKVLIDELVKKGYTPVMENLKSTKVQTEVQIDPRSNDDYSYSDDSDSILKRFYALRDFNIPSSFARETPQRKENNQKGENTQDRNNTHDGTIGQKDTDVSTETERTMEGIPELTERSTIGIKIKKEEETTDEDVSEISLKTKKSHSLISIEKRSKLIDTQDLEGDDTRGLSVVSDRQLRSSSLIKALQSFDEELDPLNQELSRLLSDFKSIDIPEDVQASVAAERLQNTPWPTGRYSLDHTDVDVDHPSTKAGRHSDPGGPIHNLYRPAKPPPAIRGEPCNCPPGTCQGYRRSSGIICQRIRRLPPTASSSEFLREFTRPARINEALRPHSILSEPEDIYGDRLHRRPSSTLSTDIEDLYNKPDPK